MNKVEVIDIPKPIDYDTNPQRYKQVSVVVVSDTHNAHEQYRIPVGDVFLHCGDFTNGNDCSYSINEDILKWTHDFNEWLGILPHRHKIVILGNHEKSLSTISKREIQSKLLTNCHYLEDELIEIEGLSIYGCSWAFMRCRDSNWHSIPPDVDLLMTHEPPLYTLDLAYDPPRDGLTELCKMCNNVNHGNFIHWGSRKLGEELHQRLKPKIHCFGHVHDARGYKFGENASRTLSINAAGTFSKTCYKFNFYVDLKKPNHTNEVSNSKRYIFDSCNVQ